MKVLDRELARPFDAFWKRFEPELDVSAEAVRLADRSVFGAEGYQPGIDSTPWWIELPDGALSYHVAHELSHRTIRRRGYPVTVRGLQYSERSEEARVCGDLDEMMAHAAMEVMLREFPFDRSHIQAHLFEGAQKGLEESPVPEAGSLWWATWVCRFCELYFLLPKRQWVRLEVVYEGRCPDIADKGKGLIDIMLEEGFTEAEPAIKAMVKARDALELKEGHRCLVMDPRTGNVY